MNRWLVMPSRKTYGKRTRSSLSFLSAYGDENNALQTPESTTQKRNSATLSMNAFCGTHYNDNIQNLPLAFDDSIEDMTSRRIDDTTINELSSDCGEQLLQIASSKNLLKLRQRLPRDDKGLPRLPQILFKSDEARGFGPDPVVLGVGKSKQADLKTEEEDFDSSPPPVSTLPSHTRKFSVPHLPRKLPKKKPRGTGSVGIIEAELNGAEDCRQNETRKLTKVVQLDMTPDLTIGLTSTKSQDVSQQIQSMPMASRDLKPLGDSLVTEPLVETRKSRTKRSNVLTKMKNAINERLHDTGLKNRQSMMKNEHLLDLNLSNPPHSDEEFSTVSAMEMRINEGNNFSNPKIQSLTGHGTIKRKPLADDPFCEEVLQKASQTDTNLDNQCKVSACMDRSAELVPSVRNRLHSARGSFTKVQTPRNTELTFGVDFDALFSSSPIAQSTPRLRLEPSFEGRGGKEVGKIPGAPHSVFGNDSHQIDVRSPSPELQKTPSRKLIVKRNNSQVKDALLGVKSHMSKRRKKHPSPSKAELEGLEEALKKYPPRVVSFGSDSHEELTLSFGELRTGGVLQSKDRNTLVRETARLGAKDNQNGASEKSKQVVPNPCKGESTMQPIMKPQKLSMIPKPAGVPSMRRRMESRVFRQTPPGDGSLMDTDELQWDISAYNIRRRGV